MTRFDSALSAQAWDRLMDIEPGLSDFELAERVRSLIYEVEGVEI